MKTIASTKVGQRLQTAVRRAANEMGYDRSYLARRGTEFITYNYKPWGGQEKSANTNVRIECDPLRVIVRYGTTDVVELQPLTDHPCHLWRVTLDSGGWQTRTTKARINDTLNELFGASRYRPYTFIRSKKLYVSVPADNDVRHLGDVPYTFIQSTE